DESGPAETGYSSRQPGEGIAFRSKGPHGLVDALRIAIDNSESGLGSAVARAEAGAAGGEDKRRAYACPLEQAGDDRVLFVRDEAGFDGGLGPRVAKQSNHGGARSVSG